MSLKSFLKRAEKKVSKFAPALKIVASLVPGVGPSLATGLFKNAALKKAASAVFSRMNAKQKAQVPSEIAKLFTEASNASQPAKADQPRELIQSIGAAKRASPSAAPTDGSTSAAKAKPKTRAERLGR
jgi:hypothetical protein